MSFSGVGMRGTAGDVAGGGSGIIETTFGSFPNLFPNVSVDVGIESLDITLKNATNVPINWQIWTTVRTTAVV
jgi:hypothetical protein